jgi:hypothetical protein
MPTPTFYGGFLIYTIMLNLEEQLQDQIEKNDLLKKLLQLMKENDEMENRYLELWLEKQHKRVKELLELRKIKEANKN